MLLCGISRFKRYNFQAGNKSESAEFLDDDDSLPEKTGPNDASGTESLGSFPSIFGFSLRALSLCSQNPTFPYNYWLYRKKLKKIGMNDIYSTFHLRPFCGVKKHKLISIGINIPTASLGRQFERRVQ